MLITLITTFAYGIVFKMKFDKRIGTCLGVIYLIFTLTVTVVEIRQAYF